MKLEQDVFSDVLEEKSDIVWTLTDASFVEGKSSTIKLGSSYLIHPFKSVCYLLIFHVLKKNYNFLVNV